MMKLLRYVLFGLFVCYQYFGFAQNEFRVGIEARNKYTQRPVMGIISVLPAGSDNELVGSSLGDAYVVRVKPNTTYQIMIASQDYKTYRQIHSFDPNTVAANGIAPFIIELDPLNPPKNFTPTASTNQGHSILVFDKTQRTAVANANIILKNTKTKESLGVRKSLTAGGTWLADLKEGESYSLEIIAPDYLPQQQIISIKPNQPTEIALTRIEKQGFKLKAVDALTGKPIPARFKLTDEIKESYTGTTQSDGFFMPTAVVQKQPYTLTVVADGYKPHTSKINVSTPLPDNPATQLIKLYKTDIELTIRVFDEKTNQPIEANIKVINQSDKKPIVNIKSSTTPLKANPENQYSIEIQAKDFAPFQQPLDKALNSVSAGNTLNVYLKKLKGESYINLSAVDATTKQPLVATFKVSYSTIENPTELKSSASGGAKYKISEPDIYKIETIVPGYEPLKGEIDTEEMAVGQNFDYEAKLIKIAPPKVASTPPPPKAVEKRMFMFKVIDAQNRRNVSGLRFKVANQADNQNITSKISTSGVQVELSLDQKYAIEVSANNYEAFKMNLDAGAWAKRGEFLTNISLVPVKKSVNKNKTPVVDEKVFDNLKVGQSLTIEDNVYFDQSSYILRPEANRQLDRLVVEMKRNPKLKIEITGHTDNVGDPRLNLILSENRAKVIANYLIYQGVEEKRIIHRGLGQTKPLAPNDNEDNMRRNRRVEFVVKDV